MEVDGRKIYYGEHILSRIDEQPFTELKRREHYGKSLSELAKGSLFQRLNQPGFLERIRGKRKTCRGGGLSSARYGGGKGEAHGNFKIARG